MANVYKGRDGSITLPPMPRQTDTSNSLRHVAELAGVSVATASRVMSGSTHPVSELTREKVLSAANTLSFEPNRLARALVTARSQTVGVIVHDISDPYFGDIVKGLEDGLAPHDYRLFVSSSERDAAKELDYLRAFQAHQVDAIVLAASSITDPDYITALETIATRFISRGGVMIALSDHTLDMPRVRFDNRKAVSEMIGYLAERGHRQVGYIGGPSDLEVSAVRRAGFEAAVAEYGLASGPEYMVNGGFSITGGETAMARLIESTEVTAVLAANDLMAIGATRHLLAAGLSVPEKVSVAGFDDIPLAAYGPVPLTTMRVPTYEIGLSGAGLLLQALAGEDPTDVVLTGEIVERESVGPAPGS